MSYERLNAKKESKKTGFKPEPVEAPKSTVRSRAHDGPVMMAAKYFVQRAEEEGLQLAKPAAIIYYDLSSRVTASGVEKITGPDGKLLTWDGKKKVWPDMLLAMIDLFFDYEYNHNDKWCWQEFCGVETFGRLQEYMLFKYNDAHIKNVEFKVAPDWVEELRERNLARQLPEPVVPSPPEKVSEEEAERLRQEAFGDDLEVYNQLMEKRRRERAAKLKRRTK